MRPVEDRTLPVFRAVTWSDLRQPPVPAGVRAAAAHTLGVLKCAEASEVLIHHLTDRDTGVVVSCCFALGELKAGHAVEGLGRVLQAHRSSHARAAAAMAFEKMADRRSRDALMQGLLDPSAMVRIHSLRAMTAVGGAKSEMFIDQMRGDGNRLHFREGDGLQLGAGNKQERAFLLAPVPPVKTTR